jgi:hypothetical protein
VTHLCKGVVAPVRCVGELLLKRTCYPRAPVLSLHPLRVLGYLCKEPREPSYLRVVFAATPGINAVASSPRELAVHCQPPRVCGHASEPLVSPVECGGWETGDHGRRQRVRRKLSKRARFDRCAWKVFAHLSENVFYFGRRVGWPCVV